jgi:hypothetical protein
VTAPQQLQVDLGGGARALFSDRSDGNLSSVGGDGRERAAQARARLRERIGVSALARGYQVHGTHVRWVAAPLEPVDAQPRAGADDADGQATALGGTGVIVLAADCVPVALGADGVVAMLHAGWRGLAAGVLEEGVRVLRAHAPAGAITAAIGPCAGVCCYEVGADVHAALGRAHAQGVHADLRAVARERLLAAGVEQVRDVAACTICDERFFSHRREGAHAGRQAGVAWLS